jgi:hypothetical protein
LIPSGNFQVGDEIEVVTRSGHRYEGVITKVVYTPPPAWSSLQTGYTIIVYKTPNGETNCVSEEYSWGLRKKNILDRLVEGLD